jgi:hypothetical protein
MLASDAAPASAVRPYRILSWTLGAAAAYDVVFAALMLAAPRVLSRFFSLPLPGERFYLRLLAVLLVMLGATYLVAARDPRRFRGIVAVAIAGRFAGASMLALEAVARPDLAPGLWAVAAADAAWALAHLLTARGLFR